MNKRAFRKLKRLELVELIYQLRKDNLEWRKRCKELEKQLRKAEKMAQTYASNPNDERLERIENMLADIQRARQLEIHLEEVQSAPYGDVTLSDFTGEEIQSESAEAQPESEEAQSGDETQPEADETQPEADEKQSETEEEAQPESEEEDDERPVSIQE